MLSINACIHTRTHEGILNTSIAVTESPLKSFQTQLSGTTRVLISINVIQEAKIGWLHMAKAPVHFAQDVSAGHSPSITHPSSSMPRAVRTWCVPFAQPTTYLQTHELFVKLCEAGFVFLLQHHTRWLFVQKHEPKEPFLHTLPMTFQTMSSQAQGKIF